MANSFLQSGALLTDKGRLSVGTLLVSLRKMSQTGKLTISTGAHMIEDEGQSKQEQTAKLVEALARKMCENDRNDPDRLVARCPAEYGQGLLAGYRLADRETSLVSAWVLYWPAAQVAFEQPHLRHLTK